MDVGAWLRGLGLGRYERAFRDNDVDAGLLPTLTADDLRGLGVASLGHRKRLLAAIAALAAPADRPPAPAPPAASPGPAPQAERRQLTVVFVDLVGSTALSARLDPEELRAILRSYQDACAAAIVRFGGHVAKYLGDGVLAYFGWPVADEGAAAAAVRAGLEIADAVPRLAAPADGPHSARVGIATGLAVVGDLIGAGAAREEAVVGEVVNLAARLQQLAEPGTVVVADGTRRLLGGAFDLADLGGAALRGFPAPVPAWRVAGEGHDAASRFDARHAAAGLAPLVGRGREVALLVDRWRLARGGQGQAVLVSGEPGIGKSRLAEALARRLANEPHGHLVYQCSPQHAGTVLHPFVAQLEHAAGFRLKDSAGARLAKLETLLARSGEDAGAAAPALAALLGLAAGGRCSSPPLSPQQGKERTLEALLGHVAAIAARQPVLLVFEDLHWIDPTSLELLGLLVGQLPDLPVLAILTARPEFAPPWAAGTHVAVRPLRRLRPRQAAALARATGGKGLPAELLDHIVARTDGVPLFVEELTRTVLEAGLLEDKSDRYALGAPLPAPAIPTTLQDSLMARLDRLGPAKEVAQLAACLGRDFSHETLVAAADQDGGQLRVALDRLVGRGLVVARGEPPAATYSFRHALVQEAAYGSLLKSRRRELHRRIARAMEARLPDVVERRPEWLAHHHAEAGQVGPAVEHWLKAARRAKDAHANKEAAAHLTRCLDAVEARRRGTGPDLEADELQASELQASELLGDLASLAGDLDGANRRYGRALAIAADVLTRAQLERKRHRPRTAVRGGARIAFYEHGGGPETLVFVAPLAYGLATFQPLVERLCQEFRVVTVDSRGTGASDPLVRPYPLSEHVEDMRTVIQALGGGPVVGIGISRGANLLLKLAHAEPGLFSKLVTIGCPPGPPGQFFSDEYLRQHRHLVGKGDLEGIVRFHTSLVFSEPATRELRELFVRSRLELPRETMLSFFDPDLTVEVTPILPEIAVPVLVTHGSADRLVLFGAAEFIEARLPDARLCVFEGKGHLPLFTATDEFCEALRGFVRAGTRDLPVTEGGAAP